MHFSRRTAWQGGVNAWTAAVLDARQKGHPLVDLTTSNPTSCGLGPNPEDTLTPLHAEGSLRYTPDPLGMRQAREAVSAYYLDHQAAVDPERVCLTTSTSEAYSFLFRLLCNPHDEVLIACPSYPLFDLLATLDNVVLREYPLLYEPGLGSRDSRGWLLDGHAVEAVVNERTRAIIAVHPNNPTGHYLSGAERQFLIDLCRRHDLALIVDEVFLDYLLDSHGAMPDRATFATEMGCLCFVLSGVSKICALPQMKASWIVTSGPASLAAEAMRRLEIIADTFLSVNAPTQFALPSWLAGRHPVQQQIAERLRGNLAVLDRRLQGSMGVRLAQQGGWTAVLRVPRFVEELPFHQAALRAGVLVQPGDLYGLPDGRCVVSLLPSPAVFKAGVDLLPV